MGMRRAFVIFVVAVALAALMLRACDGGEGGGGGALPGDAASEGEVKAAAASAPPGETPRQRVRARADAAEEARDATDGAAESDQGAPSVAAQDSETRLLVRVVDEDGATVPGATVRWGRDDAPQETWREGRTDLSGELRIVLTEEGARIVASHARGIGASPSTWARSEFLGGSPQTTIGLQRAVTIRGVVVDRTGSAIRGARVDLRISWVRPAETAPDGRFEFPPVPASQVWPSAAVTAEGYAPLEADLRGTDASPPPPPLRVALDWLVTLRMRLVDESGSPLPEALLERSGTMTIPTLADGRFMLRGQSSPGSMTVAGDGLAAAHVTWTGPGPEIDLGDVRVAATRRTRVAVVWPDGTPVATASILPGAGSVSRLPLIFDEAAGVAELHLGAGTWPFVVRATRPPQDASSLPPGTLELGVASVDLRAGDDVSVTLVPAPILVVRAYNKDGAPVKFPPNTGVRIGEGRTYGFKTDADRLAVSLPGTFPMQVTLAVPGHAPAVFSIDAAPGLRIERDVVLVPDRR